MASIKDAARFDEKKMNFRLGERLMFDPSGNDEHFARIDENGTIAEIDPQPAFKDDKGFIRFRMVVPDEVPLNPHRLELVIVHFRDHTW